MGRQLLFLSACPGTAAAHKALLAQWKLEPDEAYARRRDLRVAAQDLPELADFFKHEESHLTTDRKRLVKEGGVNKLVPADGPEGVPYDLV